MFPVNQVRKFKLSGIFLKLGLAFADTPATIQLHSEGPNVKEQCAKGDIMAKKTAAEIAVIQADIPEQYRTGMRLAEDGSTIFVNFALSRYVSHTLRGGEVFKTDRAKFAGAERFRANYLYGEARDIKDGARCEEVIKGVKRAFSEDEKTEDAHRNAAYKQSVWYGVASKQKHGGSSAPDVVLAATNLLIKNVCKQKVDSDGNPWKRKTLPDFVAKSMTLDEVRRAAEQLGVGPKSIKKIIVAAEAVSIDIPLED